MHVAAACFDLRLSDCGSLKEKRAVLRPVIDTIRNRFKLSVAEIDHQDVWRRASIGVAVVASSPGRVEELLDSVERFVYARGDLEVVGVERRWLDSEGSLASEWWS